MFGLASNPKPAENQSFTFNQPKPNPSAGQNQSLYNANQSKKVEEPKVKKYTIGGDNQ